MSLTPIMLYHLIFLQSGSTPLHKAAMAAEPLRGNRQVNKEGVEILIKAGADVNVTDKVSYYSIIM